MRNAADAEDAAQDAFVKAWRALPRFRRGAPVRPWLLRIVANEARNRRQGGAGARRLRCARRDGSPGGRGSVPRGALSHDERARLLRVRRGAPDEQRLAIACRYFLDLSEEETAAALGGRRGTVKSRVSRALEQLREADAGA